MVIPTVGRVELLEETLPVLLADPATAEVILVVDNPAAESSVAALADGERVRVTVPAGSGRLPADQGARDAGVRESRSEVVLSLDDDVVPKPGLVSGHASWHAEADNLVVLGYMPVVTPKPNGRERLYARTYEWMCGTFDEDPARVVDYLWGGNFSVRRRHWLQALEARRVPMSYHGDRELGLVLKGLGLEGVFDRSLSAEHRFRRDMSTVAYEATLSAMDLRRLSAAYPSAVDPPRPSRRAVARAVARAMEHDRIDSAVGSALTGVARVAAATRSRAVEEAAVRALWKLSFDRAPPERFERVALRR